MWIGDLKQIEHDPARTRQGLSVEDVETEVRQDAADIREQERLVERRDRQLPDVSHPVQKKVNIVGGDAAAESHVLVDVDGIEEGQVALRQSVERLNQFGLRDVCRPGTVQR